MSAYGKDLSPAQLDALSRFLGGAPSPTATSPSRCTPSDKSFTGTLSGPYWNGWGAGIAQRRFQSVAMAQLSAADVPRLKLKWAFGFPDVLRAYAQPAVVGGWVFVGSAGGKVYALDAGSGCTHWELTALAPVRTAISVGQGPTGAMIYFGPAQSAAVTAIPGVVFSGGLDGHLRAYRRERGG